MTTSQKIKTQIENKEWQLDSFWDNQQVWFRRFGALECKIILIDGEVSGGECRVCCHQKFTEADKEIQNDLMEIALQNIEATKKEKRMRYSHECCE